MTGRQKLKLGRHGEECFGQKGVTETGILKESEES